MERQPRGGASPGLLRRRYSVPETIMRRYRLAQQTSDSEEWSVASAAPPPAALRRRAGACCCGERPAPATRSLDGSHSELGRSSRHSQASAGWATPKRQRLEARDFRGSDEMLRAAMRNSYDRAESRDRPLRADLSDAAYHPATTKYAFTDSDVSKSDERSVAPGRDASTQYSEQHSSGTTTLERKSVNDADVPTDPSPTQTLAGRLSDGCSLSDSTETFSASQCTAEDTLVNAARPERPGSQQRDHSLGPYREPLVVDTVPSHELLEIVVSETLDMNLVPAISAPSSERPQHTLKGVPRKNKNAPNINIDEYVSNILVESLNSLSDQLECMSASVGGDRKISIVEKEIKVKLQNTAVNTIVHLSPMSNHQIIFGNEELCNVEGGRDGCNNALRISAPALCVESNNNESSAAAKACTCDPCDPCEPFDLHHEDVNQAVLQPIQKLFNDEFTGLTSADYSKIPEISHFEMSDVNVFLDNAEAELAAQREQSCGPSAPNQYEVISGVGAGNYYQGLAANPVVPRFSALPHTDSMEVNTSSSDDADLIGSECTSLVDSLDDPNSPRSVILRRTSSSRRGELVRSAIDILDLLPENIRNTDTPKDKSESFFIGIKDNECDCDKENVNVADRMPEKIKQRLYRRHRKRELRMECARRTRGRREREQRGRPGSERDRRGVERECAAIINALIDDVIHKIAQDEYKCMRIKDRPNRVLPINSDDIMSKRTWRKDPELIDERQPFKSIKNGCVRFNKRERRTEENSERDQTQTSQRTRPAAVERTAKRVYQKSEIHEGNKCIEILEILEYVNGSQSSPENTNSDENHNHYPKNKKSRIPVPIPERTQRSPSNGDIQRNNNRRWSGGLVTDGPSPDLTPAVPPPRERSNSLRFRQTFDIIPEERSSISLDSGNEEVSYNRRASAPDIVDEYRFEEPSERECEDAPLAPTPLRAEHTNGGGLRPQQQSNQPCPRTKSTQSAATSPMSDVRGDKRWRRTSHQTTMTSPSSKSAATSPWRASPAASPSAPGTALAPHSSAGRTH